MYVCQQCVCFSSGSFPESGSLSGQNSRDEEVSSTERTPLNFSVPEFPAADSEEGLYYQTVLLAVERWFSLFGWPNGPHPISVPHTLRRFESAAHHLALWLCLVCLVTNFVSSLSLFVELC